MSNLTERIQLQQLIATFVQQLLVTPQEYLSKTAYEDLLARINSSPNYSTFARALLSLNNETDLIAALGIQAAVPGDWNATSGPGQILNKPAITPYGQQLMGAQTLTELKALLNL